jgi:hypothetical protein
MLNITLTLTAAPELIAAITNISNALRYQNNKVIENASVPVASKAVRTEQYVQTVLPMDISGAPVKSGGVSGVQQQDQGQADVFQSNAQIVPTTVQGYTMEQLAVAATQLVDAGRRTELVSLLSSFGVQALTALPKEQYGAFATQLRSLGAKI